MKATTPWVNTVTPQNEARFLWQYFALRVENGANPKAIFDELVADVFMSAETYEKLASLLVTPLSRQRLRSTYELRRKTLEELNRRWEAFNAPARLAA